MSIITFPFNLAFADYGGWNFQLNTELKDTKKLKLTPKSQKEFIQGQYMDGLLPSTEYQELKKSIDVKLFENERNFRDLSEVLTPYN